MVCKFKTQQQQKQKRTRKRKRKRKKTRKKKKTRQQKRADKLQVVGDMSKWDINPFFFQYNLDPKIKEDIRQMVRQHRAK